MSFLKRKNLIDVVQDFALVKWLTKSQSFSVVQSSKIVNLNTKKLIIGNEYQVIFNNKKYKAILIKLGSNDECEQQLELLTEYNEEERPTKKLKNNKENFHNESIEENKESRSSQNITKNDEIVFLKSALKVRDEVLAEKDKNIEDLKKTVFDKDDQLKKLKSALSELNPSKLVDLGKTLLRNFGTDFDLSDITIATKSDPENRVTSISTAYPEVRIPLHVKLDLENEIKCNKSGSRIFRLLIGTLIVDDKIWANSNASTMFENYPAIINACLDYINQHKPFTKQNARKCLREISSEARRRLKKVVNVNIQTQSDSSQPEFKESDHKQKIKKNSKITITKILKSNSNFSITYSKDTDSYRSSESNDSDNNLITTDLISD